MAWSEQLGCGLYPPGCSPCVPPPEVQEPTPLPAVRSQRSETVDPSWYLSSEDHARGVDPDMLREEA